MNGRKNIIRHIGDTRMSLRNSERKVADLVLAAPSPVVKMTMAELAAEVQVSEPTVIRFCRAVGCSGFRDFKLRLAESLVSGAPYVHSAIDRGDDTLSMSSKILNSTINALGTVRERINIEAIDAAIELLDHARRIDVFALGLTSAIGLDVQQKFLRFDIPVLFHLDTTLQTMAAATLQRGDVALVFSYHGQQRELVRTAEVARSTGANVITVTRTGSRLSGISNLHVAVDTEEDTFIYAPMTTRIAHMAIVDILATGVALRRGPQAANRFRQIKNTMRGEQWPLPKGTTHLPPQLEGDD